MRDDNDFETVEEPLWTGGLVAIAERAAAHAALPDLDDILGRSRRRTVRQRTAGAGGVASAIVGIVVAVQTLAAPSGHAPTGFPGQSSSALVGPTPGSTDSTATPGSTAPSAPSASDSPGSGPTFAGSGSAYTPGSASSPASSSDDSTTPNSSRWAPAAWYLPQDLPFAADLQWTFAGSESAATPAGDLPPQTADIACKNSDTPTLPTMLSAQQKVYTGLNGFGIEEVYVFKSAADARNALHLAAGLYTLDTCQVGYGADTQTIHQTGSLSGSVDGYAWLRTVRAPDGSKPTITNDGADNHEFLVQAGAVVGYLRLFGSNAGLENTTGDTVLLQKFADHIIAGYGGH